jgi:hypothetical protein
MLLLPASTTTDSLLFVADYWFAVAAMAGMASAIFLSAFMLLRRRGRGGAAAR